MSESLTISQVEDALHMHGFKFKKHGESVMAQCYVCGDKVRCKGLCCKHYRKMQRYGDPTVVKRQVNLHGLRHTKEYKIWDGMMQRCNNPNSKAYPDYGGRGIKVCDRWEDPENFCKDVITSIGHRPDGMSLDRIDNSKGYEPGNVRWASAGLQSHNRRFTNKFGLPQNIRLKDNKYEVTVAKKYIGRFVELDQAVSARDKAAKEVYG